MNDILKQRLVGALVLIALGVIFWPVVFVESDRGSLDRTSQVPDMPELDEVSIPAPEPLANSAPVSMVDKLELHESPPGTLDEGRPQAASGSDSGSAVPLGKAAGSDSNEDNSPPVSPSLDAQGIPVAWVLQVASVSTREKADALVAELISAKYKAYHRVVRKEGKALYRVYIGPVFERRSMVTAKREVDKRFKVSSIIARYVP